MTRLAHAFEAPTLVGYLVGCHPDRERFLANASQLIENGCGVLEVGIPFSDPIADGPTIQQAVTEALEAGVRPPDVFDACAEIRERHPETPIVVMTYTNIAHRIGYDTFAKRLRQAGLDGAILADLPPEHATPVQDAFAEDLSLVLLAGPATDDARLAKLIESTRGFLYLVGLFGVTGARTELEQRTIELTKRVAPHARKADTPLAIGFGVSKPEHASALIEAGAHGVVVGSAFVQRVLDEQPPEALGDLAAELSEGVEQGASEPGRARDG